MSDLPLPKKNEALLTVRKALRHCPECGRGYEDVFANSHRTDPEDPDSLRFYFQFVHGKSECIAHTHARDFAAWLEAAETKEGDGPTE